MDVRGRDATAGLPKTIHITSQEIREEALKEVVSQIVDLVKMHWIVVNLNIQLT